MGRGRSRKGRQELSYLGSKVIKPVGFFQKIDAGVQNTLHANHACCVTGHVKRFHVLQDLAELIDNASVVHGKGFIAAEEGEHGPRANGT